MDAHDVFCRGGPGIFGGEGRCCGFVRAVDLNDLPRNFFAKLLGRSMCDELSLVEEDDPRSVQGFIKEVCAEIMAGPAAEVRRRKWVHMS